MDLSTYEIKDLANEGAVMPILDPMTLEPFLDDGKKPMWIQLQGIDSDTHTSVIRKVANRRLQHQFERGGKYRPRAEDFEEDAFTQLVRCTVAWHIQLDGEVLSCTEEEKRKVYTRLPWLKRKAEEFREDQSNFFASSKPNSPPTQNGQHPVRDE